MDHARALERLRRLLPTQRLIVDPVARKPYETDGLTAISELPWAVALPETAAEVAQILAICREESIPVVPPDGRDGAAIRRSL